jgi:hypothetical protein
MIRHIGIEIAFRPVHRDLTHQPGRTERLERVVDRRQRHLFTGAAGSVEQPFRRHMPVAPVAHQQRRQRHPLPGRAQVGAGQPIGAATGRTGRWVHFDVHAASTYRAIRPCFKWNRA